MSEKYCPNCGGNIPFGTSFCTACGCRVKAVLRTESDDDREKRWFLTDFLVSMRNTAIVLFVILAIVFFSLLKTDTISFVGKSDEAYRQAIDNAKWANEHFPAWDELYDAGDYETMSEVITNDIQEIGFQGNYNYWKHYSFYNYYHNNYQSALTYIEKFPDKPNGSVIYDYMKIYGIRYDQYSELSADEKAYFAEAADHLAFLMSEYYGIPADSAEEIYRQVTPDGYVVYSKCSEYADAHNESHSNN